MARFRVRIEWRCLVDRAHDCGRVWWHVAVSHPARNQLVLRTRAGAAGHFRIHGSLSGPASRFKLVIHSAVVLDPRFRRTQLRVWGGAAENPLALVSAGFDVDLG